MGFYTVKQMSMRHQAFSESALRALIFKSDQNGLAPAIIRVGRKVLMDDDKFIRWLKDDECLISEEEAKFKHNPHLVSDQPRLTKSGKPSKKSFNETDQQELF